MEDLNFKTMKHLCIYKLFLLFLAATSLISISCGNIQKRSRTTDDSRLEAAIVKTDDIGVIEETIDIPIAVNLSNFKQDCMIVICILKLRVRMIIQFI